MVQQQVSEIRKRAGSIFKNIFTSDFEKLYQESLKQFPNLEKELDDKLIQELNDLIELYSHNLDNKSKLNEITKNSSLKLIQVFFLKYHNNTQIIVRMKQTAFLPLPSNKQAFFKAYMDANLFLTD